MVIPSKSRSALVAAVTALSLLTGSACSSDKHPPGAGNGGASNRDASTDASDDAPTDSASVKESGALRDAPLEAQVRDAAGDGSTDGGITGCNLSGAKKPKKAIPNPVTTNLTLTSDTVWTLQGVTHVQSGKTLTIEPCTRIEGSHSPVGVLLITRGAKIDAEGTADEPILFTSQEPVGSRQSADWGGVILLGNATTDDGDAPVTGIPDTPDSHFGGANDADNSGVMKYLRIEYAGFRSSPSDTVSGLTFAGVGSGTVASHVDVNHVFLSCFSWFGGAISADHLVCNTTGDGMFYMNDGYRGTLQYLFGRQRLIGTSESDGVVLNGKRIDPAKPPPTIPTMKLATLCGFGPYLHAAVPTPPSSSALSLRGATAATLENVIAVGFDYGANVRDTLAGAQSAPPVTITNSVLFDMLIDSATDGGQTYSFKLDGVTNQFDQTLWFNTPGWGNSTKDPGFETDDCQASYKINKPPNDKVTGSGKGAFKDGNWLTGKWIDWAEK